MAQVDEQSSEPALISERPGERFGLAQAAEAALELPERMERDPQVEAKIDGVLQHIAGLRQMPERRQRLLEAAYGLPVGRSCQSFGPGVAEVGYRLLPQLTPDSVMGQPLDVLG